MAVKGLSHHDALIPDAFIRNICITFLQRRERWAEVVQMLVLFLLGQVDNCDNSNSRLVVDEDNGKFRLARVKTR